MVQDILVFPQLPVGELPVSVRQTVKVEKIKTSVCNKTTAVMA